MSGFIDAMMKRRSTYGIKSAIPFSDDALESLLGQIIQNTPTAFNMQSTRAVLLLNDEHQKLWDLVLDTLKAVTPPDKFPNTQQKIGSFAMGYGTILYFDDTSVTNRYAEDFTTYRDLFPDWALQQNGMLQYAVWAALAERGVGASLQHYNPIIDQAVAHAFSLPDDWRLLAQMPFGEITQAPASKDFLPLEMRLKTLK